MEPLTIGIIGLVLLFALLFSGVWVAVALGVLGVVGIMLMIGFEPAMGSIFTTFFYLGASYGFIVVPLFIAMGLFSDEAGLSKDIFDAMSKWVGRIKGGLGIAMVAGCTVFGTISGSSIVTAVVFAKVAVPEMVRQGYDAKTSYGLVSASGAIGLLIPPSLLAIVYALLTDDSISRVLMAGIGPGILLATILSLGFVLIITIRPSYGPPSGLMRATWRERFVALPRMWPALVVGVIIIGGIYSGIFTATEAAGFGTFVLFILYLITKGFSRPSWQTLINCLRSTIGMTVMILFILASARLFGRMLVLSGVSEVMTEALVGWNLSGYQFMIVVAVLYLILGCFLDGTSIMAITIPLIFPTVQAMGLDHMWFAMVVIFGTQVGNLTPPVGLIIYAVKGVTPKGITLEDLFRGAFPYFMMMVLTHVLIIFIPAISNWLPTRLSG